ncbi:MAG TPA: CARDB domain-containing protein, partial [Protaetiibacter sp.]|nr:CARDB domain-containing protein [Protaetiibacter sp.]
MTPSRHPRRWALLAALATGTAGLTLVPTASATADPVNLSAGRPTAESGHNQNYASGNLTDGNQASYWESPSSFPQWVQVDLGQEATVESLRLALPNGWEARSETIAVATSGDGSRFQVIRPASAVNFPGGANLVDLDVADTDARYVRLTFTANSGWPAGQLSELEVLGSPPQNGTGTELAHSRPAQASSTIYNFAAGNAVDGSVASYWESGAGAYPATLTTQLAAPSDLTSVVLKLNPDAAWAARSQTLAVEGRAQGATTFTTLASAASYTFSPSSQNTVTIPVTGTNIEEVRLRVTANTGATGAQVAEFQVWGTASSTPTLAPNLAVSAVTSSPSAPTPTTPLTLGATVTNAGTAASAASTVQFSLGGQSIGTAAVGALAVGASANVSLSVDPQAAGSYSLSATVDPANTQLELDEGDNTASGAAITVTSDDGEPPVGDATERANGRPIQASSTTWVYTADNANDGDVTSYWESGAGAYPATLSTTLSPRAELDRVVLKLNPASAWASRTQTLAVEGRAHGATNFTTLVASAAYTFSPANQNTVTIPVSGSGIDEVRLRFTANSGSSGAQVAEFEVWGVPAATPNLQVSAVTSSPQTPTDAQQLTLGATVTNGGSAASAATTVAFRLGGDVVGTANVAALAAGGTATVQATVPARTAGSYELSATVDPDDAQLELNEADNTATGTTVIVAQTPSADLVPVVSWSPSAPQAGQAVQFQVTLRNAGTLASSASAHAVTVKVRSGGTTVANLTGSVSGAIAAGSASSPLGVGSWNASDGNYTVEVTVADDANELESRRANNTATQPFFIGRGASMPYTTM